MDELLDYSLGGVISGFVQKTAKGELANTMASLPGHGLSG
jgi:hypothetical protein